jgi:hypothetical protein
MEPTATDITGQLARPDRVSAPLRQRPGPTRRSVRRIDKILCAIEGWRVQEVGANLQAIRDQITAFDDIQWIDDDIGAIRPITIPASLTAGGD